MSYVDSRRRLALALAVALSLPFSAALAVSPAPTTTVTTNADGVRVAIGAENLGTVTPVSAFVDARTLPIVPDWQPGDPIVEIPRQHWGRAPAVVPTPVNKPLTEFDALVKKQLGATAYRGGADFNTPIVNVPGDTQQSSPPDPTGDIGTNHFVQAVNGAGGSTIRIYNKADGTLAAGPFQLNSAGFAGPGAGACTSGLGDPIVLFDEIAGVWVLTEFSSQSGRSLCVYVSTTDNPVATTWHKYAFQMPSFPDYPKYGVWPDAYYVGANESGTSGARPVYAFERAKMLAGQPASFQRITTPTLSGFGFQMIQPADLDGFQLPPAGAPGLFMRHRDDEVHAAGSNDPVNDQLQIWSLKVDFTTPANTVLTGPVNVNISEFSSNLNGLTAFNAFPQPTSGGAPGGQKLDPLRETVMNKLQYRNFGSYETLMGNLVTDIDGNDTGGIRWFELRRTGGIANPWVLHQEGTYAGPGPTQDGADRWMAGSAMDDSGNIALAYSVVRDTAPALWPSLRYVGRRASDPLGVMTTSENNLITGTTGATHTNERWGDYFQMGVDPVDGCQFWFVGEYMVGPGGTKGTRIGSFRFPECGTPTFTFSAAPLEDQVCVATTADPLVPINITVGSINGFTDPVTLGFATPLPTGFSGGYTPGSVTPPGASVLNLTAATNATPGLTTITLTGTSGATTRDADLDVFVANAVAGTVTLTAPANAAINVSPSPTLSWSAGTQAQTYVYEVATSAAFTTIVATGTVTGTSVALSTPLNTNTQYFWRVRAANVCGTSANSPVFSFTTQAAPGDCAAGSTANTIFSENVESGQNGWTFSHGAGTADWSISTARPFGGTGSSFLAADVTVTSDQRLTSPAITLPNGQSPLTLSFQADRNLEPRTAGGCWDGGYVEVSTDNGANFTQITPAQVLVEPYTGALNDGPGNGKQAWCGTKAYHKTIVSLDAYAGQSVRLRYVVSTDGSVGFAPLGWFVDEIKVQGCTATSGPFVVTPTVVGDGTIDPSTPQTVASGATTSFTVTPAAGSVVQSVTGCGGTLAGNTYTTAPITAACTVTATFAPNEVFANGFE